MSIDKLRAHYGLTRTPFSRGIAPSQIFAARTHNEAVARLHWLIDETAIGVITGEVGAGKTLAARAAVATLDTSRFSIVYLSNPMIGARGIHHHLVTALGETPRFHRPALIAQTQDLLATETEERRKTVVLVVDLTDRGVRCTCCPACRDLGTWCACLPTVPGTSGMFGLTGRRARGATSASRRSEGPTDRAATGAAGVDHRVARGGGASGGGRVPRAA